MIDPIQILLVVVITTLTILLIVIGIEVFIILKEFKKTMERVNQVLDDVETVSHSISTPIEKLSSVVMGLQQGAGIIRFFNHLLDKGKDTEDD